jgi:hypothetical protein
LIFGHFYSEVKPRAKALGPNRNKNAQIQQVKLSKQKVFVKLKNVSDKKINSLNKSSDWSEFEKITRVIGRILWSVLIKVNKGLKVKIFVILNE